MVNLPKIVKRYIHYYKLLNKEESVTIISAQELSEDQKDEVREALREAYSETTFNLKYDV